MKEVALTQGYVAIVDDASYEWLAQYRWRVCRNRQHHRLYAQTVIDGKTVGMGRLLLGNGVGCVVYVNGDGLDNRHQNIYLRAKGGWCGHEPWERKERVKAPRYTDEPSYPGGMALKPDADLKSNYRAAKVEGRRIDMHRRIMEQHLGRRLTRGEIVHHINGDKMDNRIENLQIMSRSEHTKHHIAAGDYVSVLDARDHVPRGEESSNAKLTEDDIRTILRRRAAGQTCREVAEDFPVGRYAIAKICRGDTWRHIYEEIVGAA
jgi:hypothetical protein